MADNVDIDINKFKDSEQTDRRCIICLMLTTIITCIRQEQFHEIWYFRSDR